MKIPTFKVGDYFFQVFGNALDVTNTPSIGYHVNDRANKQSLPLNDDHAFLNCSRHSLKKVINTANYLLREVYMTVDDLFQLVDDSLSTCEAVVRDTLNDSKTLTGIALRALSSALLWCSVEKLAAYASSGSITYYDCSYAGKNDFCLPLPT